MSNKIKIENSVRRLAKFRKAAVMNTSHKLLDSAKVVLFYLLECYNHESGQCNPSHATIAKKLGKSIRTVERAIEQLKAVGWLTITQRRFNNSLMYGFNWSEPEIDELRESTLRDAVMEPLLLDTDDGTTPMTIPDTHANDTHDGTYGHPCQEVPTPMTQSADTDGRLTNEEQKNRTIERRLQPHEIEIEEDEEVMAWLRSNYPQDD